MQNTHYYLAACAIAFSACSVDFMKLSFAKPLAKNGIPGISILHDTSILVLFTDNGVNVSNPHRLRDNHLTSVAGRLISTD